MGIVLILLGILFLILFIPPIFQQVHNFGNAVGISIGGILFALGLLWKIYNSVQVKIIAYLVLFGVVVLVLFCLFVLKSSKDTAKNQESIIVLGCRVKGDVPSLALIKRVESAYDFLINNPQAIAILSGGQGKDEFLSEALCMKKLLLERGISEKRLILEDKSTTTDENIKFSLKIIEAMGIKKEVAIATSEYHQKRAKMICKRYGIEAYAKSSKTAPSLLPTFVVREVFAVLKEYFIAWRIK